MNKLYQQCQYLCSAHKLSQLPPPAGREIAFAGRSNAGKSSAINAITGQQSLARVSRTPGRTQTINFFRVDELHRIVDLPGYGYAQVPEQIRRHWDKTLEQYLRTRQCLHGLMLIMDARHPLQKLDWQMIEWAAASQLALHILLTKADKLSRSAGMQQLHKVKHDLELAGIESSLQLFSARSKAGLEDTHIMLDFLFGFK